MNFFPQFSLKIQDLRVRTLAHPKDGARPGNKDVQELPRSSCV